MIRTSVSIRLVLPGLLTLSTGCTLYQPRPVTYTVRDAETDQPIAGAEVRATHLAFMDFGLPFASIGPSSGVTDRDGKLSLFLDPVTKCLYQVSAPGGLGYAAGPRAVEVQCQGSWARWPQEYVIRLYRDRQASAELVLPPDYRGPVVVYFAPIDAPPSRIGQREFTYPVSERGSIEIPQASLLASEEHDRFRARYPATEPFQTVPCRPGYGLNKPDVNLIAFRFVTVGRESGTDGYAEIYVVGTEAEAIALRQQVWPDDDHENQRVFDRILAEHPRP